MKAGRKGLKRSSVILAVAAVGVFSISLMLHGAPPGKQGRATADRAGSSVTLRAGPGIPQELPVGPPMTVDYRKDPLATELEVSGKGALRAIGQPLKPNRGLVAGVECLSNEQCADCLPCTKNICCTDLSTVLEPVLCPTATFTCVQKDVIDGQSPAGCNDGLFCNGREECSGGVCIDDANPPDCEDSGQVCEEGVETHHCRLPCNGDPPRDCDDGKACTDDSCEDTGICSYTNHCGPDADCAEPEGEETEPTCGEGRCCVGSVCDGKTPAECTALTGLWLATDDACTNLDTAPVIRNNDCPEYSSGIADQGIFLPEVGPISQLDCDTHHNVGDDYRTTGAPALPEDPDTYMTLDLLRFAGRVLGGASVRWDIEFYDKNGVFIEDVFWPDGSNDSTAGAQIKTVDFDPALIIPTEGFVVWKVQENFGPDGRMALIPTGGNAGDVDVGTNDAARMWYNGAIIEDADDAPLPSGDRVLAFELIGASISGTPDGACCLSDGTCLERVSWICEDPDGLDGIFRGVGTICGNVCTNDPFVSCVPELAGECPMCTGPDREGWACDCPGAGECLENEDGDDECVGGDTPGVACDPNRHCGTGECAPTRLFFADCATVLPACTISACCDVATGDCVETTGGDDAVPGFCDGSVCDNDPNIVDCVDDGDCPNGNCVNVTGYIFQGFGTECDPDCCEQPLVTYSGGDTCFDTQLRVINVPLLGQPPVSVTVTGTNVDATCAGGNEDCVILNEDCEGATWWESFSITDCANIRIDMCCTDISGEPLRPAWGNLWGGGCPCDSILGNDGVEEPLGIGRDTSGFARGEPFCNEDNLWMTFGPLRKGIYNYSIYGEPDGTSATPPGVQYQFHIVVGACADAACCLPTATCIGGTVNPLGPCNTNADCCIDDDCQNDDDPGTCRSECAVLNEIECSDANGYWLAYETLPDTVENVIACDANTCATGSCCTGPGVCGDTAGEAPMDKKQCDVTPHQNGGFGDFVGGGDCSYPRGPCPVCDIQSSANCQMAGLAENNDVLMSDLSFPPNGTVRADDFVPTSIEPITDVCTWGVYLDGTDCTSGGEGDGCDCSADVTDEFHVTVYEDAGGYPGTVVGTSLASTVYKGTVLSKFGDELDDSQMYAYKLVLADPIGELPGPQLTPGVRHWIEIANYTKGDNDFCGWHWIHTPFTANNYGVAGTSAGYISGSGNLKDMAFCLNTNFDTPPPVEGACCDGCTGTNGSNCAREVTVQTCGRLQTWDVTKSDCGGVDCGATVLGDTCDAPILLSGFAQVAVQNLGCATIGGPRENNNLEEDVWFAYDVQCTGRVTVNMCGTGNGENTYDSAFEIYLDNEDSSRCACPRDATAEKAGDEAGLTQQDEGCTGFFDGGAGWFAPSTRRPGDCVMIRIGGFDGARGRAHFSVGCEEVVCNPSDQVIAGMVRNRYLSIRAGNLGDTQAIRVIMEELPAPYDLWNGTVMWVGPPREVCENSGKGRETPPEDCPPALPTDRFWTATLGCQPHWRDDWAVDGKTIHIRHEGIIPSGRYNVQVVGDTCLLDVASSYSTPTIINDSKWGNMCGPGPGGACSTGPDLVTDVANDVLGCLDKFSNTNNLQKASADIEGSGLPPLQDVDLKVNVANDVLFTLSAFGGAPYPFAPSGPPPCSTLAAGLAMGGGE